MRPKISQSFIVLKSKDEKTRDEKTLDRIRNDVMNLQREINLKKKRLIFVKLFSKGGFWTVEFSEEPR